MAIPITRIGRTAAMALLAAVGAAILPLAALAAESRAVESAQARVTLIGDGDRVSPGETFMVGLRLKLAPHWHTYWVNPGDAGSSPDITLTLPPGATTTGILWPGPDAITIGPARNFGYGDEIVLPLRVQVPKTVKLGESFPIRAEASWLVCEKVCIPEQGIFALDLPIAASTTPASADIAAAFADHLNSGIDCGVLGMLDAPRDPLTDPEPVYRHRPGKLFGAAMLNSQDGASTHGRQGTITVRQPDQIARMTALEGRGHWGHLVVVPCLFYEATPGAGTSSGS